MNFFLSLSRVQKQAISAFIDLLCLPLMFCLAIWLRYDGLNFSLISQYRWLILATPFVSIPIFIRLGLYRAVVRFIDHKIFGVVSLGVTMSIVSLASVAILTHTEAVSRGVFAIYWIIAVLYVVTSRFLAKGFLLHVQRPKGAVRVAIYGAGAAGTQLANALRPGNEYLPVAFIDDQKERQGTTIAGLKVYPSLNLSALVVKLQIKEILLAMPSIGRTEQKKILDQLELLKIKIKVTPPIKSLVTGMARVQDVREVEIEDLLGRDAVEPNSHLISICIAGKSVMVTGAGGSIGSELCRQIMHQRPLRLLLLDMSEFALYSIEQEMVALNKKLNLDVQIIPFLGSVLEYDRCKSIMETFSVETVYHAAAYKHVPLVEHNPIEGIRNNVFGTLNISRAAMAAGVSCFVLISTDKAVRPTNVMGSTKRLAELILQAFSRQQSTTRFCMVRFGNVLGSSGSVVPLFRKQIMNGGPITLTHPEITRYFMTIPEAAQLVIQAGAMSEGGEVFVLDMGEPVKIIDLAKRMVHLSGLEIKADETSEGTIEIHHVGLRPGEKLYEELLIGADVVGTEHPLIMKAKEAELPWEILQDLLSNLENACDHFDFEAVRATLHCSVAEYVPQCGIEDFVWLETSKTMGKEGHTSKLTLVN